MLAGVIVVLVTVAASLAALAVMRRIAGDRAFFADNSRAGGAFGGVHSPFAVLLAFVVFLAFQGYTGARAAVRVEATALMTMFHSSELLAPASADDLQKDLVCYARAVLVDEWPKMRRASESAYVDHWLVALEVAIGRLEIRTPVQEQALAEFFSETNRREEARNDRLAEADGVVPAPVWAVLILGGAMILVYVAFFADPRERFLPQAAMTGTIAAVVSAGLMLVAFFNHPYADRAGAIEPTAIARVLHQMEAERAKTAARTRPPCTPAGRPYPGH